MLGRLAQPATLLQVPAPALRQMIGDPQLHRLLLSRMTERMVRMDMIDRPRFVGIDQLSLLELRTPDQKPAAAAQTVPAGI
jgi:hypothetical protein